MLAVWPSTELSIYLSILFRFHLSTRNLPIKFLHGALGRMSQRAVRPSSAPQRLRTSTAQLREMDSVWEQMSMELSAAVAFAVSHQPEAPLAAIVEQLSHHLPEGT